MTANRYLTAQMHLRRMPRIVMDEDFHAADSFGSRVVQHSVLGDSEGAAPTSS
jgi:hypothetical protein